MRTIGIFLGFISIALCENSLSHQERKQGFELLYDGKTLTRWHSIKLQPDAGSWHGRKGILTWVKGGSWLATDDTSDPGDRGKVRKLDRVERPIPERRQRCWTSTPS